MTKIINTNTINSLIQNNTQIKLSEEDKFSKELFAVKFSLIGEGGLELEYPTGISCKLSISNKIEN